MAKIHPTAVIADTAQLADDVEVGAFAVVEADVTIGSGCVLKEHAVVRRYTTLGQNNLVDSFAVLGGLPQDLAFRPESETYLSIGDDNVFREGVTISRATTPGGATRVGNKTLWMANSHAGHDTVVADNVVLVNGVLLAGHVTVEANVVLGGNASVHQFTWVGEGAMLQGKAGASMHVAPFTMIADISKTVGLNAVGLRRNPEVSLEDRRQIKQAFKLTYNSGLTPSQALEEMAGQDDWGPAAARYRAFIRRVVEADKPFKRGLCPLRRRS